MKFLEPLLIKINNSLIELKANESLSSESQKHLDNLNTFIKMIPFFKLTNKKECEVVSDMLYKHYYQSTFDENIPELAQLLKGLIDALHKNNYFFCKGVSPDENDNSLCFYSLSTPLNIHSLFYKLKKEQEKNLQEELEESVNHQEENLEIEEDSDKIITNNCVFI